MKIFPTALGINVFIVIFRNEGPNLLFVIKVCLYEADIRKAGGLSSSNISSHPKYLSIGEENRGPVMF